MKIMLFFRVPLRPSRLEQSELSFGQTQKKKPARGQTSCQTTGEPARQEETKDQVLWPKPIPFLNTALPAYRHGNQNWQKGHPVRLAGRRCVQGRKALVAYLEWDGKRTDSFGP